MFALSCIFMKADNKTEILQWILLYNILPLKYLSTKVGFPRSHVKTHFSTNVVHSSVAAGISGRAAQRCADQDDADTNADHPPQYRADVPGADERVGVAQSRSRLCAAAGRTVAADPGTDAKHDGDASPGADDDHSRREPAPTNAAATAAAAS